MKYLSITILYAVLASSALALDLGGAIPSTDVKTKNVDGQEITIADVKGEQGTLVIFSCNHCPFVIACPGWGSALHSRFR